MIAQGIALEAKRQFLIGMHQPTDTYKIALYTKRANIGPATAHYTDEGEVSGQGYTRGGIVLPDKAEIPTISGRVVEVSLQVERDADVPIAKYDKVLFHPKNAIPVDLEGNNLLFVVPLEDVVAVFRRTDAAGRRRDEGEPGEDRAAKDPPD